MCSKTEVLILCLKEMQESVINLVNILNETLQTCQKVFYVYDFKSQICYFLGYKFSPSRYIQINKNVMKYSLQMILILKYVNS